jgi:hypothetical protein
MGSSGKPAGRRPLRRQPAAGRPAVPVSIGTAWICQIRKFQSTQPSPHGATKQPTPQGRRIAISIQYPKQANFFYQNWLNFSTQWRC